MKKLVLLLLLTGCSHYSANEKFWFSAMTAGQFADAYSTTEVLNNGGRELNPLVGEDVYLFKVGTVGIFWLLGEIFPDHRATIFKIGAGTGFGAAAYNFSQEQ